MLPVIVTSRLDAFIFYAAFFIWLLPEVISSFTDTKDKDIKVLDRSSGVVLLICIWLGIFASINTAFVARSFAIPWDRTFVFAIGIF